MTLGHVGKLFFLKLHLWILLAALFGLSNVVLFFVLETYFALQLLILIAAITCPVGLLLTLTSVVRALREIKDDTVGFPAVAYRRMAASILSAFLFGIPGFATAGIAVLVLLPGVRNLIGIVALRPFRKQLLEGYEYLKSDDD